MQAHHPITGQPIRILQSDAIITQDLKTLIWVRDTYPTSHKWIRWSTLISEPSATKCLQPCDIPSIIMIRSWSDAWIPILQSFDSVENELLLFVGKSVEDDVRKYTKNDRILVLEELIDQYPFLANGICSTDRDEKCIISIAHILRMNRIAWNQTNLIESNMGVKRQYDAWTKLCEGRIIDIQNNTEADQIIPDCWLIQQYFKHPLPKRAREIWNTLEKNCANPYIDKILLLNESTHDLPSSDKLIIVEIGSRLTYADVLSAIQTRIPENTFVLFSNADIWFDASLFYLWSISLKERRMFLALLRWEGEERPTMFGPRADSQDAWIVAKETIDFPVTNDEFGFPFGKPGCDNAIPFLMLGKKCLVSNPAYSIKSYHMHSSNIRNYDSRDILYKPFYMHINPSAIQPFNVVRDLSTIQTIPRPIQASWNMYVPKESFSRRVDFVNEDHAKTICTSIRMKENNTFELQGSNTYTPHSQTEKLYCLRDNVFVTPNGLLSSTKNIYIGQHSEWEEGWQTATVSSLTPSIHIPSLAAIHVDSSVWSSLSQWVLRYLPHVLRIRNAVAPLPRPEFIIPSLKEVSEFLYDCDWKERHIATNPYMEDIQYYSNLVWAPAPNKNRIITKEDILLLRELLPSRCYKTMSLPTLLFCTSERRDAVCTPGWVEEVIDNLLPRSRWNVLILKDTDSFQQRRAAFQMADWVFGEGSALDWIWIAKKGARVIEFMSETNISSQYIHLAGACELQYTVSLVRKEPIEYQRQNAMMDVGRIVNKFGFNTQITTNPVSLPVVIRPENTKSAFAEIVDMWEARGYCSVKRSADTEYFWMNGIGEVLLYDRDMLRWLNSDTTYQFGLFANCVIPQSLSQNARQSVWSYWGYSPKLLEDAASNRRSWSERSILSVCLGKIQNGIQQSVRKGGEDWSTVIEDWSMPIDSTNHYPYTQTEYLDRISNAKFGLCVPSHANKCHREIEYMAVGTVPIITPDVDMSHYINPPKEGVHYLRVEKSADIPSLLASIDQERWEQMSLACYQWWLQNSSTEGLFRLTVARIEQCKPFLGICIPLTPPSIL